jgi:DNA-binding transcriptional regulator YhcF (GntR family)
MGLHVREKTDKAVYGSEASLGRTFNVSRATIRDALRTLEAQGIVEIRLGGEGGAYVAQGNPERLSDVLAIQFKLVSLTAEEIIDSQLVMESAALDLAMANATEQDVADLRTHQQAMLAARETPAAFNKRAMAAWWRVPITDFWTPSFGRWHLFWSRSSPTARRLRSPDGWRRLMEGWWPISPRATGLRRARFSWSVWERRASGKSASPMTRSRGPET